MLRHYTVNEFYRPLLEAAFEKLHLFSTVRILIVVDPTIELVPAPGAFGIGRVIDLLRASSVACLGFSVTLARRTTPVAFNASPGPYEPTYEGWRFDRTEADGTPTINRFHEIWCFGFDPGNDGSSNDGNIDDLEPTELRELTRWMNARRGGMFATGDHHYLGGWCRRIPRVGTMRLWDNAQGVPPRTGLNRIDTNRPATPAQSDISGGAPAVIPDGAQRDHVAQRIEWVTWTSVTVGVTRRARRPHPVLCHPEHGPIDVMPDHPHEGRCFDTESGISTTERMISLGGSYDFGGGIAGPEYPSSGTARPHVIAYGVTTPDPPYNLAKGDTPFQRFPMISVYDGHVVSVGRVAVDSTWHHWMDMNLVGLEAAADPTNWEKVSRYFLNLAVWLAPPGMPRRCLIAQILESNFTYVGFQEYARDLSVYELGRAARLALWPVGPCWITEFVVDWIRDYDLDVYHRLLDHFFELGTMPPKKPGGPCLSCPPFELIEDAVLGGIVRVTMDIAEPIKRKATKDPKARVDLDFDKIEKQAFEGAIKGLREFAADFEKSQKEAREVFAMRKR